MKILRKSNNGTFVENKTEDREYPVAAAILADGKIFEGRTHFEAIQKAIESGYATLDDNKELIDRSGKMMSYDGSIDLFRTNKGRIIDRFKAFNIGEATASEDIPESESDTLEKIIEKHKKKGLNIHVYDNNDAITLGTLVVPKGQRKQGYGTEFMNDLCGFADRRNKRIELNLGEKTPGETTSKGRLIEFYKRFGFVRNFGRTKNYSLSCQMYRNPIKKREGKVAKSHNEYLEKTSQHMQEKDYPSVDDIASYAEALKLFLSDGMVKDEESCKLIAGLPSPINIRKRLSNQEARILFQTIGYLWKKITNNDPIHESKVESKPDTLCGNYWMIQKGILLFGPNHFTIIKQNLDLFKSLLGINAFVMHEKIASPPNELIKLILDHGGMRIFVNQNKKAFFQMTDETYGKWAGRKIRKYDLHKKIVKVIDKTKPYKGWRSGITIIL